MKLYNNKTELKNSISIEQYNNYFTNIDKVSTEALSDYVYKILDVFHNLGTSVLGKYDDRQAAEVLSKQFELNNKIKYLEFTLVADNIIYKQENFSGKFVDYISDLKEIFSELTPVVLESGDILKLAISDYLNTVNIDNKAMVYGYSKLNKNVSICENLLNKGNKYFTKTNGLDQDSIRALFKTLNDFKPMHEDIAKLDKISNQETSDNIKTLYNSVCMLLDHLATEVGNNNISLSNDKMKKELSIMVHDFAKILEIYGYFKNTLTGFYKVHLVNIDKILSL